jgi:hypothetical protein
VSSLKEVGYLCTHCKQQRRLQIDVDMHKQRRELGVNGLASYIDVHSDKNNENLHGVKLSIDANFHVRTNSLIKVQVSERATESLAIPKVPIPSLKIKELNTRHTWKSWAKLQLETQGNYMKFTLENPDHLLENLRTHTYYSPLKTVKCIISYDNEQDAEIEHNTKLWIGAFAKYLELASDLFVDLIPEILQFIDENTDNPLTSSDETAISILMDRAAILVPDKEGMSKISEQEILDPMVDRSALNRIAEKLSTFDKIRMAEIQEILEDEIIEGAELEEETIVFCLVYLINLDLFDHKLSFLVE